MLEEWKLLSKQEPNTKKLPEAEPGLFMTLLPTAHQE